MSRLIGHLLIPTVAPLIFFAIAFTPVEMLGCRTRGLLALVVALISGISALCMAVIGLKLRVRNDPGAAWWVISTVVLTIPLVALLAMA